MKSIKNAVALLCVAVFFLMISALGFCKVNERGIQSSAKGENVQMQNGVQGLELLASFTTYFNAEDRGRSENISIAAGLIDNITVQAYGEFSFNQTVGRRTENAGFKQAKIIVGGEYVLGVGGGVCQVSTTLYNAVLLSGLTIMEFHPHSLRVSYVEPSRDAMVSTSSDLKFFNPFPQAVKIKTKLFSGGLKISVYGKKDGYRYELISKTLEQIPPPPPLIKESEKDEILRAPKNGVKSEAYLEKYQGEQLLSRIRLRTDEYKPTQGIFGKKNQGVEE
jgi:vancomycin resistance protein YoaR